MRPAGTWVLLLVQPTLEPHLTTTMMRFAIMLNFLMMEAILRNYEPTDTPEERAPMHVRLTPAWLEQSCPLLRQPA